jgi:Holliday junction resolvase YEN1
MGVAGLWDVRISPRNLLPLPTSFQVLKPAAKTRSLTELAVREGFQTNPKGLRGYRIGIDASIWFFHAEYGKEGENPVLRTLFFRCATLMKAPFLPLFVFDGPKRPDFKRGKRINKSTNKLITGMKTIVEAFGFEWRTVRCPYFNPALSYGHSSLILGPRRG